MAAKKEAAANEQQVTTQTTPAAEAEDIIAKAKAEAAAIVAEAQAKAVNGRSFQIKRGETVQVPAYVAEVLEQSMAQDNATANLIERESSAYAAEAKARNI